VGRDGVIKPIFTDQANIALIVNHMTFAPLLTEGEYRHEQRNQQEDGFVAIFGQAVLDGSSASVGAVAKAKHVNKTAKIDAQNESRSSEKRDKLMAKQHQMLMRERSRRSPSTTRLRTRH
jgi:hypothetical protein